MTKYNFQNIIVVVLAAGQGKRMGTPKVLAKYKDKIFAKYIATTLETSNLDSLWVFSKEKIKNQTFEILNQTYPFIFNLTENADMFSSIVSSSFSKKLINKKNIIILPVDFPFISHETLEILINQSSEAYFDLIIPTYNGKKGHPVVLSSRFFTLAVSSTPKQGLQEVIRKFSPVTKYIKTNDPFILKNFNTPSDLNF